MHHHIYVVGLVQMEVGIFKDRFFYPPVLKKSLYAPMIVYNNLNHIQPHMQAVGRCQAHAKATGGAITSEHNNMLANQKLSTLLSAHYCNNGGGSHMYELTMKLS